MTKKDDGIWPCKMTKFYCKMTKKFGGLYLRFTVSLRFTVLWILVKFLRFLTKGLLKNSFSCFWRGDCCCSSLFGHLIFGHLKWPWQKLLMNNFTCGPAVVEDCQINLTGGVSGLKSHFMAGGFSKKFSSLHSWNVLFSLKLLENKKHDQLKGIQLF